jgi:hypothetical protein
MKSAEQRCFGVGERVTSVLQRCFGIGEMNSAAQRCFSIEEMNSAAQRCFSIEEMNSAAPRCFSIMKNHQCCKTVFQHRDSLFSLKNRSFLCFDPATSTVGRYFFDRDY